MKVQNRLAAFTVPKAGTSQHNKHPSGFIRACRNWRSQAKQGACLLTDAPKILLLSRGLPRPLWVPSLLWTSDLTRLGPWQGLPNVYALSDGWNAGLGTCIIAILAVLGSAGVPEQKLLECHRWSPGRRFEGLRRRTVPSRNCTAEEGCV